MTATTIRVQMAQRKDTAANWTAANPILLSGEIGYETDTKKFKIGNGSTAWNSLAYLPIPDGSGNLTITGNLEIGSTGSLTFEGSTADGFETTLAVTNPTADRTITLPDVTGTVVTTGDTGSVTSTMIANGTIVDADISSTAEIAVSKLANGTANQVIVTDGTNVSWSDNLTLAGDLTVNGTTTTINTQDLLVEDKNIIIGNVATPSDVTADGGGITLKGATDKTINWVDATDAWTLSEHVNIASGKEYRIAGTKVLDATSLGSSVLITSANITNGTIVDGDISATAEIAVSKLADGTARQLLQTDAAGTGVEWASNIDIPGTLDVTGAAVFDSTTSTTGTSTAASFIPTSSTAPTNGLYLSGTNTVGISTGGTGRLFVDASGRVGIGGSPGSLLEVSGSGSAAEIRLRSTDTTNAIIRSYINSLEAGKIAFTSGRELFIETAGAERARIRADGMFEVKGAGVAGSSPAFSVSGSAPGNSIQIDSSGRLLVGTSSAATVGNAQVARIAIKGYPGSVTGQAVLSLQSDRAVGSITAGNRLGEIGFNGADGSPFAEIYGEADGTAGTGDYPGRLVFSTTANGAASPTPRMTISKDGWTNLFVTANDGFQSRNSVAAGTGNAFYVGRHSATSTSDGTISYVVYTNGNVQNTNGSYTTLSDVKLKENIVDASSQWDDLKAIQIRNWNFKAETGHETHRQIGPIAQELEEVCPGLVFETPDRDSEGNDLGTVTKGVNQSVLYMKAVKALQEAMERIETLEAKVAALEAQ